MSTFRLYKDDTHWTAVSLKDGGILEVKGPGGSSKERFDSVDAWRSSRAADGRLEETRKVGGIQRPTVSADTHGFHYDYGSKKGWLNWCYEIMLEGAPHLLERTDVRDAFNALYKYVYENKIGAGSEVRFDYLVYKHGTDRYSIHNLSDTMAFNTMFVGFIKRLKIAELYERLMSLISDDITNFIRNKHYVFRLIEEKRKALHAASVNKRRIDRYKKKVEEAEKAYAKALAASEKLNAEIAKLPPSFL
jgi:hypothetical protein